MSAADRLIWAIVLHLVIDWLLQNEWQATYKVSLRHPAAYVHSGLHLLGLLLVFPGPAAAGLALAHLLIDTRWPLQWWRRLIGQTTQGPMAVPVAIWSDQAAHIGLLALACWRLG